MPYPTFVKTSFANVLIANDDEEDALMLTVALKSILPYCKTIITTDGIAALRYLKTNVPPDLVFLDLNMPLRRGLECLHALKSQPALSEIPVIVYSTSQNIKDIDACYKAGAKYYLLKPESFRSLQNLIKILYQHFASLKDHSTTIPKDKFVLRHIEQEFE